LWIVIPGGKKIKKRNMKKYHVLNDKGIEEFSGKLFDEALLNNEVITVNSVSGGKTSAYIMANYPADANIFSLVRTKNRNCLWMKGKDEKTRQIISDRLGYEFIGTLEFDDIIYTILDLEQFTGSKINVISSEYSFEDLLDLSQNNVLPSTMRRYCTQQLKVETIYDFCQKEYGEVVRMNIGFRANEHNRAKSMLKKVDDHGVLYVKTIVGKRNDGKNAWATLPYSKPEFPLINDAIYRDKIEQFWKDKPVRFAWMNNCVGCFHKHPILLRKMWDKVPEKMQVFADMELDRKYKNDTFLMKDELTYERIRTWQPQGEMFTDDDFNECDSGYCGM
jgi:hypothetical protein